MSGSDEEKVAAALRSLLAREVPLVAGTRLREDLGLDSASLIELTVVFHSMYGVDLGRVAAEHKIAPETVGDLALLLSKA